MTFWKQYACTVILCVFCCRVLSRLNPKGNGDTLLRLVCGVILGICVLQPLSDGIPNQIPDLPVWDPDIADTWVRRGEQLALQEKSEGIKASCEAYILDKAKALDADILVEISLNEELVPVYAEISGDVDPDVQRQLQSILTTDLGIPGENQTWIWNQENKDS